MGTSFNYTQVSYIQESCQHSLSMGHLLKRLLPISQWKKNVCNLRTQLNVYLYEYFKNHIARSMVSANALWNRILFSLVILLSVKIFGWFFIRNYTYEQKTIEIDERENIVLQKKITRIKAYFLLRL